MNTPHLILASTSPYRKAQLSQLGLPFTTQKPICDEDAEKKAWKSNIEDLALHLAIKKAQSLASPECTVIGGDQMVLFQGEILGKPGTKEKAIDQLSRLQGQTHSLITAISIAYKNQILNHVDVTQMHMKKLNSEQIQRYIGLDQPFDCAGSCKIEKHGIALFENIETKDFTSIQGLPLLALSKILGSIGYRIP